MALSFAYPIRFLEIILTPIIKFVVFIINLMTKNMRTEEEDVDEDDAIDEAIEELSSIIETAEDEDVLDEDQSDLIQAAIDFLDVSAVEVMTSRVDLVSIDIDDDPKDIEKIIFESGCSRIPVYKDSIDNIIGILYTNHYLRARTESESVDISEMLMDPLYAYKAARLTSVLDQLREKQIHIAIVCDEYGGTIGVVTMEDILEEIVGDIWDETDEIEEDVKELSETKFEVDGDLAISDFCELVDIDEDEFEAESETVGGWALEHFETYPENGDSFEDEGLKVKILSIEDRRVEKLYIEKLESEEESEE
jgi:CBS domain containing-hemolysin-like protein